MRNLPRAEDTEGIIVWSITFGRRFVQRDYVVVLEFGQERVQICIGDTPAQARRNADQFSRAFRAMVEDLDRIEAGSPIRPQGGSKNLDH